MVATLLLLAQIAGGITPARVLQSVQTDLERPAGRVDEGRWRTTLAQRPTYPAALIAVGIYEAARYRYERSDSLLTVVEGQRDIGKDWLAAALIARSYWRALVDQRSADSLLAAARILAQASGSPQLESEALLLLFPLRNFLSGARTAKPLLDAWWSLPRTPSTTDTLVRWCQGGLIEEQLGDSTASGRMERGARRAEAASSWRLAGSCRLAQAQASARRGDLAHARRILPLALQDFERPQYHPGIAVAAQWAGTFLVGVKEFAAGKRRLEQAVAAAQLSRFAHVEGQAWNSLAELSLDLGDLTLARDHARRARAIHERTQDQLGLAHAMRVEGSALEAAGDLAGAIDRWRQSQLAYGSARFPVLALVPLALRVGAQLRLGWVDSAARTIDEGRRLGQPFETWRRLGEPQLRGRLAVARGRYAEAESLYRSSPLSARWRRGETSLLDVTLAGYEAQLALRDGRLATADTALDVITGALERWRSLPRNASLTAAVAQIGTGFGRLSELYPDLVAQLAARGRVAAAFEFVERIRARDVVEKRLQTVARIEDTTAARRALRADRDGAPVVTVSELRRQLRRDEAFVTYMLGEGDTPSTALVVSADTVATLALPGRGELLPDVQRYLRLASAGTESMGPSRRLGAALMQPVLGLLPASVTYLAISTDGELHRLPMDALRLPGDRRVLERVTVSMVPSATAWLTLRATAPAAGPRLLAVGDPLYPAARQAASSRTAALSSLRLPRLTYSGDEARRVARYAAEHVLLTGSQATERSTLRALGPDVGVVHFAVHGLVDDGGASHTAIALAPGDGDDGFLTVDEVSQLSLRGPLVVLSACRSSGGAILGGEGLRGLTAPLLESGARAVVGTHWSIGDRSIVPIVDRFYAAMAAGQRADDALRQAKLAAIQAGVSIADWGAFTITGDAAMRPVLRRPVGGREPGWITNIRQALRDTTP
jgi:CHAT domain-containing protein